MTVTGHIPEGLTAFDGVTAGMDQINHISYIVQMMAPEIPGLASAANPAEVLNALRNFDADSEPSRKAIQFLKSHGTVVDPTLTVFEMFQRTGRKPLASFEPGVAKVAPALSAQLRSVGPGPAEADLGEARFAASLKAVTALHRAGVPIVVGTDQSVPGHSLHREMELYVEAGFTPMEALQAATMVPARVMGVEKEVGTLEVGKRADHVILGANPLDNISNIRRIETVVQGGTIYDCAALWRSAEGARSTCGFVEERYLPSVNIALVCLAMGDQDTACEWLDRALSARHSTIAGIKVDPDFAELRSNACFQSIRERIGLRH